MVNAVFASHHYRLKFIRADAVLPEFLFRDRLDMIEWPPIYMDVIFLLNVVLG